MRNWRIVKENDVPMTTYYVFDAEDPAGDFDIIVEENERKALYQFFSSTIQF